MRLLTVVRETRFMYFIGIFKYLEFRHPAGHLEYENIAIKLNTDQAL